MRHTKIASDLSPNSQQIAEQFTGLYYRDLMTYKAPQGYTFETHENGSSNRGNSKGAKSPTIGSTRNNKRFIAYIKQRNNNWGRGRGYTTYHYQLWEDLP